LPDIRVIVEEVLQEFDFGRIGPQGEIIDQAWKTVEEKYHGEYIDAHHDPEHPVREYFPEFEL
jgi:hypothetical protein